MEFIEKMLRKKNVAPRILGGLALICLALLFAYYSNKDLAQFIFAKDSVFGYACEDMQLDKFYDVTNNVLYDCYAEDDQGYYYITSAEDRKGNTKYMGFYVYEKDSEKAYEISEATWNAIENGESEQPIVLKGKGIVYEMSSEEKLYFEEYFNGTGVDESMLEYKTIYMVPAKEVFGGETVIKYIIAAGFAVWGIWLIISFFTGKYKKQLNQIMTTYAISPQALDYDMRSAEKFNGMLIGQRYFMPNIAKPWVMPFERLVWVYPGVKNTRHMLYGVIPMGTTKSYSVNFKGDDGSTYACDVKNEDTGRELLKKIYDIAPYALYGYSDENIELCTNDFDRAIATVSERRLSDGSFYSET